MVKKIKVPASSMLPGDWKTIIQQLVKDGGYVPPRYFWKSLDGKRYFIKNLEDSHLHNIINYLRVRGVEAVAAKVARDKDGLAGGTEEELLARVEAALSPLNASSVRSYYAMLAEERRRRLRVLVGSTQSGA